MLVAHRQAKDRACHSCAMCCYLLDIPELEKPHDVWCKDCRPGKKACTIYKHRPKVCQDFRCLWLEGWAPDFMQPQQSRMVMFGAVERGTPCLKVVVDARKSNRWREVPYWGYLRQTSLWGLRQTPKRLVVVFVGQSKFLVLGDNVVENPPDGGYLAQKGLDDWAFVVEYP